MLDGFFSGWAFENVISQKRGNKVFGSLTDTVPNLVFEIELANLNGFHDLLI
jgi:hypothetical protein